MLALLGIELAPRQVAICVVVPEWREDGVHFVVRLLERHPRRMTYSDVAERLQEILDNLRSKQDFAVFTYINATSAGLPAVESIREQTPTGGVRAVDLNFGSHPPTESENLIVIGKAWLVSRLQVLLQEHRLHFSNDAASTTLISELSDYSHRPVRATEGQFAPFNVGTQDELVNAVGLAVHETPIRPTSAAELEALIDSLPEAPGYVDWAALGLDF